MRIEDTSEGEARRLESGNEGIGSEGEVDQGGDVGWTKP